MKENTDREIMENRPVIEVHITVHGAEQQITKLRASRSSTYEFKRRKERIVEADVRNVKSDICCQEELAGPSVVTTSSYAISHEILHCYRSTAAIMTSLFLVSVHPVDDMHLQVR
jgi:hypothetical protein